MKTKLYFTVLGSLLCAAALSMGGCSKEKDPVLPENDQNGSWDRHVFLRIENCSSVGNDLLTVHFSDDESHCDTHGYWERYPSQDAWKLIHENDFIPLSRTGYVLRGWQYDHYFRRDPKDDGGVNFVFAGSNKFDWHQRVIVSIGRDDQENLMIKAKSTLREEDPVETWIPWKRPGRKVQIEVVKAMAAHFEEGTEGEIQVYVYLKIKDFNGSSSEGEQ